VKGKIYQSRYVYLAIYAKALQGIAGRAGNFGQGIAPQSVADSHPEPANVSACR